MTTCVDGKKNISLSKCKEWPRYFKTMFTLPEGFVFEDADIATPAAFKTRLQAAIKMAKASRVYLWPTFQSFEDLSSEVVYADTTVSYKDVDDGQYRFKFNIDESLCVHKAMFSHRATDGIFLGVDKANQVIGMKNIDNKFTGLSIALLKPEKAKWNDGSNPTLSPIMVALRDNLEFDQSGYMLDGTFGIVVNQLVRLADVNVAVMALPVITSGAVRVKVTVACDGTPVSGLLPADFIFKSAASGLTIAVTTAPEDANNPGEYSLTQAGNLFVDGTVNLRAASLLTVSAYESTGAATVDVP